MPRVNLGKTPEQLAEEARERHTGRVLDVIRTQMAHKDISRHELSEMTMVDYSRMGRLLRGAIPMDLWTMTKIANALGFTPEQRAAMVGGKLVQ